MQKVLPGRGRSRTHLPDGGIRLGRSVLHSRTVGGSDKRNVSTSPSQKTTKRRKGTPGLRTRQEFEGALQSGALSEHAGGDQCGAPVGQVQLIRAEDPREALLRGWGASHVRDPTVPITDLTEREGFLGATRLVP